MFSDRYHLLRLLCLPLALALTTLAVRADETPLGLAELIQLAIKNNPTLAAERYIVEAAAGKQQQAGSLPNPRLELSNTSSAFLSSSGEYSRSIGLSQDIPVGGRLGAQEDAADAGLRLATANLRQTEATLASQVATSFYRLLVLNRQIATRAALIAVDQKLLDATTARMQAGEVSPLDVSTAELETERLKEQQVLLQNQYDAELANLNQLLGRPARTPLAFADTLPADGANGNLADLQQQALKERADLQAARFESQQAQAEVNLARSERWEDWSVGVSTGRSRLDVMGAPPQATEHEIGVTLSIPLPLWNRNKGNVAAALSSGRQADAGVTALKLQIENEVTTAFSQLQRLSEVVARYRDRLLPLSEKSVALAQQGYNQGQVSIVEVVTVERQHSEVEIAYLDSLDQYLQAYTALNQAVGAYNRFLDVAPASSDNPSTDASHE